MWPMSPQTYYNEYIESQAVALNCFAICDSSSLVSEEETQIKRF